MSAISRRLTSFAPDFTIFLVLTGTLLFLEVFGPKE
jgi:hypothetical protein